MPFEIRGQIPAEPAARPVAAAVTVAPGYFQTLRAALIDGRDFTEADDRSRPPVAIVNERFARLHWPSENPLGRQLRLFDGSTDAWLTIVGVATNIRQNDPNRSRGEFDPVVYRPIGQQPLRSAWVVARTTLPAAAVAEPFRREVQALDRNRPIWVGPHALADRLAGIGTYWRMRNGAGTLALSAVVAVLLASLGLCGVVGYAVRQRTKEIGVRLAIGGTARQVLWHVCRPASIQVAVGLGVGVVMASALTRALQSYVVGITPADPATLALVAAIFAAAAIAGCAVPARRALSVDPVVALRNE